MKLHTPHIAILPSPGMGHLIPLVEFAKRLMKNHQILFTIIIPTTTTKPPHIALKRLLDSLPETINHVFLPPVTLDDLPSQTRAEVQIFITMNRCLPSLRDELTSLRSRANLVGLVFDMFGSDAFDVAKEINLSTYLFFPPNAMCLAFTFMLPRLDEVTSSEFKDLPDPIMIPGCVPFHGKDIMGPVQVRDDESYKGYIRFAKRLGFMDGILVNSFMDLEEGAIKALQGQEPGGPPIYPVGPLIQTRSSDGSGLAECLYWLDNQPAGSVLFVCFGSGGTLSSHQLKELALGLENSGQNFLWVVKSPNDKSSSASFFIDQSQNNPLAFLPQGFLERTMDRALVVPSWAPQIEILSHGSTGGFLSHCGWNSTLESIVHGVPLIAWPLYAEQKMNAVMLSEGLNIALRPKVGENGIVGRDEVEKVVKILMVEEEGKIIRNRVMELKDAAKKVLGDEGSSTKALNNFAISIAKSK